MKKLIMTLLFLFTVFSLGNIVNSNAESNSDVDNNYFKSENEALTKKIAELEKEIFIKNLIQYVEFESELIIPKDFDSKYVEAIWTNADTLNISTRLAFRLVFKESSFIDTVKSVKGADGLMQLMPETRDTYYKLLSVDTLNLDKNEEDIYIGLVYLRDLYDFWYDRGNSEIISWKLALASYNAGQGKVLKYKGIPPYDETQKFVAFIAKKHSNPDFFANYNKKYGNEIKDRS